MNFSEYVASASGFQVQTKGKQIIWIKKTNVLFSSVQNDECDMKEKKRNRDNHFALHKNSPFNVRKRDDGF